MKIYTWNIQNHNCKTISEPFEPKEVAQSYQLKIEGRDYLAQRESLVRSHTPCSGSIPNFPPEQNQYEGTTEPCLGCAEYALREKA